MTGLKRSQIAAINAAKARKDKLRMVEAMKVSREDLLREMAANPPKRPLLTEEERDQLILGRPGALIAAISGRSKRKQVEIARGFLKAFADSIVDHIASSASETAPSQEPQTETRPNAE